MALRFLESAAFASCRCTDAVPTVVVSVGADVRKASVGFRGCVAVSVAE